MSKNKSHYHHIHMQVAVYATTLFVIAGLAWTMTRTSATEVYGDYVERGDAQEVQVVQETDETESAVVPVHNSSRLGDLPQVLPTPDAVKAVYMTSWIAGLPQRRQEIISLIEETELNAIVIDIKDDTGKISYDVSNESIAKLGSVEVRVRDMQEFLAELQEKNIYTIGRIAVFQDPYIADVWPDQAVQSANGGVWEDRKGLKWVDASSMKHHEYIVALAKDATKLGFDEINFDYIRFPTDGAVDDMVFPLSGDTPKRTVMQKFFAYLENEMKQENIVYSGDVFGLVTSASDDMGIGQVLEDALVYFDYVAPMVYPSHYAHNSFGLGNPNDVPGKIIARSMGDAVERARQMAATTTYRTVGTSTVASVEVDGQLAQSYVEKLRPWLQDFDYGGEYTAEKVRAQIDASEALGLDSWFLWDPSVRYTRAALD